MQGGVPSPNGEGQFSRTDLRRQCSYAKNSHLPASTSTQTGTYRAHLNTAVLLSPSGVYKSEADCESGTDIAVTFDCPDRWRDLCMCLS